MFKSLFFFFERERNFRNLHFPISMPIKCLSEGLVFRGEHLFVRRWRETFPICKVTSHLLKGLLWSEIYLGKLTGIWIDWTQQWPLSVLCSCLALWSVVKPGPSGNFPVRMEFSLYIAELNHPFTPSTNATHLDNIVQEFYLVTSIF